MQIPIEVVVRPMLALRQEVKDLLEPVLMGSPFHGGRGWAGEEGEKRESLTPD